MYQILIVDDEKMIRMGIQKSMPWEEMGISKAHTAASAREALEIVDLYHPHIIITDISMAEMTGLQLIEEIRREDEDCKIVVLTGYDRFDYARQALQLRAQDFLLKPVDENELMQCIRRQVDALEQERRQREEEALTKRTRGFSQQAQLEMDMCRLITGTEWKETEETKFLARYPDLQNQPMQAGILLLDIPAADSRENRLFRLWSIKSLCLEVLDEKQAGITFNDGMGRIILVFINRKTGRDNEEKARELIEFLESESGSRIRIVLGSPQIGPAGIRISYNDAMYSLEHEIKKGKQLVKMEWDERRDSMFRDTFGEFKQAMLASINDAGAFMHVLERFFQSMESYNISGRYACRCLFELASAVYYTYIGETGERVNDRLDGLMESLRGMDRVTAQNVAMDFFQKLLNREQGDEYELVRQVKKIIRNDLAGDLSIPSLADYVHVTPNYLSRMFKRLTGEGCSEYITRKRVEKAKCLLETTSMKAGEIACLVGYHDISYFSMAFKKQTGLSPVRYRMQTIQRTENL